MPARTRENANLPGAHETLLLDELPGGICRHAGPLESPRERSTLVLLHGLGGMIAHAA